jgi:hypothetical protein
MGVHPVGFGAWWESHGLQGNPGGWAPGLVLRLVEQLRGGGVMVMVVASGGGQWPGAGWWLRWIIWWSHRSWHMVYALA